MNLVRAELLKIRTTIDLVDLRLADHRLPLWPCDRSLINWVHDQHAPADAGSDRLRATVPSRRRPSRSQARAGRRVNVRRQPLHLGPVLRRCCS